MEDGIVLKKDGRRGRRKRRKRMMSCPDENEEPKGNDASNEEAKRSRGCKLQGL